MPRLQTHTASERIVTKNTVLTAQGEVSESVPDFEPILWITVYVSSFYDRKFVAGLVVCFLRQLCSFLCGREEEGENHKTEECGYQSRNNCLTKVDAKEHSLRHMLQIDYGNGSQYQRSNGSCRRGFLPEVSQNIGEERTCSSECKAEHQDRNDALGIE